MQEGSASRLHACLPFSRQVRHDAEESLDEHQLAAMVHLVFLGREQHLEAALARGRLARKLNALSEEIVRKGLESSPCAFWRQHHAPPFMVEIREYDMSSHASR